jgi:hypothetical protein
MSIDHSLVYQARKFTNAANIHFVKTWIFCYETSDPDSPRRKRYEQLLRDFVTTRNVTLGLRLHAKHVRDRGIALRKRSIAIEEEIKRFF